MNSGDWRYDGGSASCVCFIGILLRKSWSSDPARGAESHLRVIELADRRRISPEDVLATEKRTRATLNCLSCLTIALSPVSQSGPSINVRESAYEFEME